jgi:hypothetical protein
MIGWSEPQRKQLVMRNNTRVLLEMALFSILYSKYSLYWSNERRFRWLLTCMLNSRSI